MTAPELPVRPTPYIAVGNGWTVNVNVPGYGVWRRDASRVSGYAVYNQTGSDYHITIDHSYISTPASPKPQGTLGTHITSNAAVGSRVLHWPDPGFLSPVQQDWMDEYNGTTEFDDLIAAFEAQIRLCATNVKLSRDYDTAMEEYGRQRFAVAAESRKAKQGFDEELAARVEAACPPDAYVAGFQKETDSYFLDINRGTVVLLEPKPLLVYTGDGLSPGFTNMCGRIIGGKVSPLTAAKWGDIRAGLVLLRLRDKEHAMLTSDFDACMPAKTLLSLDQVVDQAVSAWTQEVRSSKAYTVVATDNVLSNVTGPGSVRFHLETVNLLDMAAVTRLGVNEAKKSTGTLKVFSGLVGVYDISCVAELQSTLPEVVRLSKGGRPYIVPELLVEGWSTALEKSSSVDANALAVDLIAKGSGCQLFAENLVINEKSELAVYVQGVGGSGSAYYLGTKEEVVPAAKESGTKPLELKDGQRVRSYFGNGLSSTVVASSPDQAIVICNANKKSLTPPLFVAVSKLEPLDLTAARKGYAAILQKKKEAEEAAAAKLKADAEADQMKYANAWTIIQPQLGSGIARLKIYKMPEGAPVAVADGAQGPVGGTPLSSIKITKTDRNLPRGSYRYLEIAGNDGSYDWIAAMAKYIAENKPDLPGGFKGYFVTRKK